MSKITLTTLSSLANQSTFLTELNNNFSTIQSYFDNCVSRDGDTPNSMTADFDMNSNRLVNLAKPVGNSDAARLADLVAATTALEFAPQDNVESYGAVGDGVTDCTDFIDTAIAGLEALGGGTLWFPRGDYYVTAFPTASETVKFAGEGRIVTSTSHRRTWEYGYAATTQKPMTWYVDPSGNDANSGLSAAAPFKTPQRAFDQLPPIIRHQQTIILAAGDYTESDLAYDDARQWDRPAVLQLNGKWITGRTNEVGSNMVGGVVFRGAGNTSTYLCSATNYSRAICYVTGHSMFLAMEDLGFKQNGATVPSAALYVHKGARVQGQNLYFDANNTSMSGVISEQGIFECTNPTWINGTGSGYTVLCEQGIAEISRSSAGNYDDGSYGGFYARYQSLLWFSGYGTLQTTVQGRDSTFVFEGNSASNRIKVNDYIQIENSNVTAIYTDIIGTATQNYRGGCSVYFQGTNWQDELILDASNAHFKDCNSYVSPATANTKAYAIYLRNGADYTVSGSSNLVGSSGLGYSRHNREQRTLVYTANSQTLAVNPYDKNLQVYGSTGSFTSCQISSSNFGDGDRITVEGDSGTSVQFISGTHMDLPFSITIGGSAGDYTGMTLEMRAGKWRLVGLGGVR